MVRTARSKPDSGTNCDEAEEEEKDSYSLSASDDIDDRQDGNEHLELQNDEDIEMEEVYDSDARDSTHDDESSIEGFDHFMSSNDDSSSDEEPIVQVYDGKEATKNYFPSMRHGGCINTATWLSSDCGWRLSTRIGDELAVRAVETEELPSQVVTSGDDRLLKVWDVSEAMSTNPWVGGTSTLTPFSSSSSNTHVYEYKEKWQSFYDFRRKNYDDDTEEGYCNNYRPQGTVRLLASIPTGHRGNVFHVTPLNGRPGTFATCGADGFLRLVDIERNGNNSTAVVHPMYDHNSNDNPQLFDPENPLAYFLRNSSGMCFSHTMLDGVNVGLLCSEKGLLRFDFRLSPREQCTRSLLPRTVISPGSTVRSLLACKACAVLRTGSNVGIDSSTDGGSTYVFGTCFKTFIRVHSESFHRIIFCLYLFISRLTNKCKIIAGGSSPFVALCDLRMTVASTHHGCDESRVLQYYKPISLSEESHVSVSGLDVSRDGKELLVSYESDQIYTFPVFPNSQSPRRAAIDQLGELLSKDAHIDQSNEENRLNPWGQGKRVLPELAAYGAHLNRFTFLKNARYAGPRDDYICTGSDSGHAWVYEKSTGAVVSLWKADTSTCNGVVPHPILPMFVTYGIDSTAKLWRSTTPVDSEVDDSAIGRRKHFRMTQKRSYKMTPAVRNWGGVQSILENLDLREASRISAKSHIYPDQIPCSSVLLRRGRLARTWFRESAGGSDGRPGAMKIGNNLHNLPSILKGNMYTVLRSLFDDDDVPVESDFDGYQQRISSIRLRHQADRLGLTWDPTIPWWKEHKVPFDETKKMLKDLPEDNLIEPSELVPDHPSDWIPYDIEMSEEPYDFRRYFCCKANSQYADYYRDRYYALDERGIILKVDENKDDTCLGTSDNMDSELDDNTCHNNQTDDCIRDILTETNKKNLDDEISNDDVKIKDGDNHKEEDEIMVNNNQSSCSKDLARSSNQILAETVKVLKDGGNTAFKAGNIGLAAYRYDKAIQYGSLAYMNIGKTNLDRFDELLKNLVMTRLNMALVLLDSHFMELQVAFKQAKLALQEVSPFCDPCKIENRNSLDEALAMKAKACFRLGSAQYEMGDYSDSIHSLEESVESTHRISNPNENTPDSLVLRRLAQAKREFRKHAKRQRKKFKFAFAPNSPKSPARLKTESTMSSEILPSLESVSMSPPQSAPSISVETTTSTVDSDASLSTTINPGPVINTVTPMNSPSPGTQTALLPDAASTKGSDSK